MSRVRLIGARIQPADDDVAGVPRAPVPSGGLGSGRKRDDRMIKAGHVGGGVAGPGSEVTPAERECRFGARPRRVKVRWPGRACERGLGVEINGGRVNKSVSSRDHLG